jgi:hypothetical protein
LAISGHSAYRLYLLRWYISQKESVRTLHRPDCSYLFSSSVFIIFMVNKMGKRITDRPVVREALAKEDKAPNLLRIAIVVECDGAALPGAVKLAPAAVGVTARLVLPVLFPQQHQGDPGPAQLVVDMGPIGLGLAPRALLAAVSGIQHRLQHAVGQRRRQRPAQARRRDTLQGQRHRAARDAQVENQVGLVRERFFTPRLRVTSYEELNAWLLDRCVAFAKAHKHPELADLTIWQAFEAERAQLVPIRGPFDGFHATQAAVSKTCLVRFDNNKYSVARAPSAGRSRSRPMPIVS